MIHILEKFVIGIFVLAMGFLSVAPALVETHHKIMRAVRKRKERNVSWETRGPSSDGSASSASALQ